MKDSMAMVNSPRTYIPAAGRDIFLPFYDVITRLLGADNARAALIEQAHLRANDRVLDVGCGTGTLITLLKRRQPEVEVVGLDPDPKALARARRKAERAAVSIRFNQGVADALEYPSASYDVVFSSFMFHHLEGNAKERALAEILRVLKPGGSLFMLDFEQPRSGAGNWLSRLLHTHDRLKDNSEERILMLITHAGFADAQKVGERAVMFGLGRAGYYRACARISAVIDSPAL